MAVCRLHPSDNGKKINNSQHAHLIIPVLIWTVDVSEEHSGHTPNVNHLAIFFEMLYTIKFINCIMHPLLT